MRQFVKLNDIQNKFEELGIAVTGMTYDAPEAIQKFHERWDIQYPLLRDVDAQHVEAWGIRNQEYVEGNFAGIPNPGVALLSPEGEILAKFAEPGYRGRPDWSSVLSSVESIVGGE